MYFSQRKKIVFKVLGFTLMAVVEALEVAVIGTVEVAQLFVAASWAGGAVHFLVRVKCVSLTWSVIG